MRRKDYPEKNQFRPDVVRSKTLFDPIPFAEWLTEAYRRSPFKSLTELAKAVGSNKATISRLMNASPQTLTGRPSQPRADLVRALAEATGADELDGLMLAGHVVHISHLREPQTFAEFIAALEQLGIDIPGWDADLDYENEDFEELKNRIALDAGMVLKRKKK